MFLTADRLVCLVYDQLAEPRSFKAPLHCAAFTAGTNATGTKAQPHAFAGATQQAHDPFSLSVFEDAGGPAGLFALRRNREFPLRRLVGIKEDVSSTGK